MISILSNSNCCGIIRHTVPISLKASAATTTVECIALAALASFIVAYYLPHAAAFIGVGTCGATILFNIGLFSFTNRQELFFGGRPLQNELHIDLRKYRGEQIKVDIGDQEYFFYKNFIIPFYEEWEGNNDLNFNDFFNQKILQDNDLLRDVANHRLRLFTRDEREKLRISFTDEGALMQIGLEGAERESILLPGSYIFVLKEIDHIDSMYLSKKEQTPQGRVHHSSFFHDQTVKSAGMVTIGEGGYLTSVQMYSGHFLPTRANIPVIQNFLKESISNYSDLNISISMPLGYF